MSHYTDADLDVIFEEHPASLETRRTNSLIADLREARNERCTNPLRSEIPCDSLVRENDALRKERDFRSTKVFDLAAAIREVTARRNHVLGTHVYANPYCAAAYGRACGDVLEILANGAIKAREPLTDEKIEAENESIYHDASNVRGYSWKDGAEWARSHYEAQGGESL